RLLFELNPQPMWVFDRETLRFLAVNAAAVKAYGYSEEEFLGMRITDIRPDGEVATLLEKLADPKDGFDRAGLWTHRTKDGSAIRVEISSHAVEFEGRGAEMVLAVDVTERLRAESELRVSESNLSRAQRIAHM